MKRAGLKKIFIGILSIGLITNTMGLLQPVHSYEANNYLSTREVNQDTIIFNQEYPKIGEPLTVTTNLTGALTYKWIIGNKVVTNATSYSPTVKDLENFIEVEISNGIKTLSTKTYFSRLPVVYVNTENGADITSKDYYINGEMKIQGNEQYNLETTKLYDGKIEIKGRGNSTWGLPKKPYKIKLDSKTNLFSMGKNKHWVLLANYYDSSSLRNTLSYDLSGALDMPQTETVHTGVVLNGKYVGLYQFCEQIRVDEKRVDVLNWDDEAKDLAQIIAEQEGLDAGDLEDYLVENLSWTTSGRVAYEGKSYLISNYDYTVPSIDGGYLLELDSNYDEVSKFKTNSNQPLMFKAPEFVNSNQDMMNYVKNYLQAYEDAVMSSDYHTLDNGNKIHYSDLFDMDSLVDYWLVTELFFNEDGMKKSTYMYKDVDGKFHMGPIWDMDWSSGANQSAAKPTDQWQTLYFPTNANPDEPQLRQWYRYLIQDPYFVSCVKERYQEIRDNQIADMMASIEDYRVYLKEAGMVNSSIWYENPNTGQNEITRLKSWLTDRLAFMDEQFSSFSKLYTSLGVKISNEQMVLTDHNGIVLPVKNDYDGISNAHNMIQVEIDISDQNTKKVALYSNGKLIDEAQVVDGKVRFEYIFPASGSYVLQAYKLDNNSNVISDQAISVNLLAGPKMELESIKISSLPNKLVYYQGEELDLTGLEVQALYNTGDIISLKPEEYTVSPLTAELGLQIVTVSYGGKTTSFSVQVEEVKLESLTVKQLPSKVEYHVGDKLDLTGLIIEATYNNGITKEITDYTVSELTDKVGKQTVTVSYQNKEITFTVMVYATSVATDKTALSIAIEMANAITQEQLDKLVPAVANEFNAALENAIALFNNDAATQNEVDVAFDRLAKVMQMLEFYKGDKALLQKLVTEINNLTGSDYSEASWIALQAILKDVDKVIEDVNAMQSEVDKVYTKLVTAFVNLRLIPNKDLLNDLINKTNGLAAANYSVESWAQVARALEVAKGVLDNAEASVEEVNNANEALTKAIAGLVANPDKPVENNLNTVKPNVMSKKEGAAKTGDEMPAYGLLASLALVISLIAIKKKKCS